MKQVKGNIMYENAKADMGQDIARQVLGRQESMGRPEKTPERGQIPIEFERLQKQVKALSEAIGMLEERLKPVISEGGQVGCPPGSVTPAPPQCSLAIAIRHLGFEVEDDYVSLQKIYNNIQL
jgi:hypothetical protein